MALKAVGQRIPNQMNAKGPDKTSPEEVSGLIELRHLPQRTKRLLRASDKSQRSA
jgi:hypothetical protein